MRRSSDRSIWSGLLACIHQLMLSRSVNDRLIDELAQQTPIPCARGTRRLRHQYGNEILGGIDPEVRARIACPIVVPGGPRECCDTIGDAHSKTQSECVAFAAEEKFTGHLGVRDDACKMVARHEAHRRRAQHSDSIEGPTI